MTLPDTARPDTAACHSFRLTLSGFGELTDAIEDALAVRCPDGTLGIHAGVPYLDFDREADSLDEAIKSAIKDVEECGAGIQVMQVVPSGAETIDNVNAYLRLRRQLRTHLPPEIVEQLGNRIDEILAAAIEDDPAETVRRILAGK